MALFKLAQTAEVSEFMEFEDGYIEGLFRAFGELAQKSLEEYMRTNGPLQW